MAPWLATALESCVRQTHKNLEILVIDDGSHDSGPQIAKAYAAVDSRIRFIQQENAGAGAARQRGQDEATGDYITWLDADDFLAPEAAEVWLEAATKHDADLVCGNAVAFSSRTFNARKYFYHPPAADLHFDTAPRYWKSKVLWRWVFSQPLIKAAGLRHTGYKLGQDVCFMFEVLLRAKRFAQVEPFVYYFRQEHKSAHASLDTQIHHGFAHFLEAKRILLQPPDGLPRYKPFIKYLNENYWRDIKKTAPRLVGKEAHFEDTLIELGVDLFSGLEPLLFRESALAPEVKEQTDFLPYVDAMIAKDVPAAKAILEKLRIKAKPATDKRSRFHMMRHTLKTMVNPLAWTVRSHLRRLERQAGAREDIPREKEGSLERGGR